MDLDRRGPISLSASAVTEGIAIMYGHPDYYDPNADAPAHRLLKVFLLAVVAIAMFALFH